MNRFKKILLLMFSITLFLNVAFAMLRSLRNTLAVVDLGSSAAVIPYFELFGALPGSILITWMLSGLIDRCSIQRVYYGAMIAFAAFFLSFTFLLYPLLPALKAGGEGASFLLQGISMGFYVVCELWKPVLLSILFFGFVMRRISPEEAKKTYPLLMLGASLGSALAGPIVTVCTSGSFGDALSYMGKGWSGSLTLMIMIIVLLGLLSACCFFYLDRLMNPLSAREIPESQCRFLEKVSYCFQSRELRLMGWIVIADYIAYSLAEVLFLEVLKQKYPDPKDYCHYLGILSTLSGALTIASAFLLAPTLLQRKGWTAAALATPVILLLTEGAFFVFLRGRFFTEQWIGWSADEWIQCLVVLGSLQYCLCRAAKYTLFDSSKELAYVLLPAREKREGKLVIDGMCARVGRGSASFLSIGLIALSGSVLGSALPAGILAIGVTCSWITSVLRLGDRLESTAASGKEAV
ncbi:Npt1/Npt2 family nucleotide transporter [Estrella lausannensis]|uniref:ADP,ATP carrier protein n=1 Tax=Estrella lausannensis TaxID=483423 RepID=A0A0H5DST8_9BACT|nr:Npt1/Npt2 family nucleotide transporter [Estrella lausannensis]CRX38874.1 putative ADP/ATP translocase [Estrella lausannensis]